jgi:hypothetical protein
MREIARVQRENGTKQSREKTLDVARASHLSPAAASPRAAPVPRCASPSSINIRFSMSTLRLGKRAPGERDQERKRRRGLTFATYYSHRGHDFVRPE